MSKFNGRFPWKIGQRRNALTQCASGQALNLYTHVLLLYKKETKIYTQNKHIKMHIHPHIHTHQSFFCLLFYEERKKNVLKNWSNGKIGTKTETTR